MRLLHLFIAALTMIGAVRAMKGLTSVSGATVTCFEDMETCIEACHLTCQFADVCNDSTHPMVACAPSLWTTVAVTIAFVVLIVSCCCVACFCAPCCLIAGWLKRRRDRRQRTTVIARYETANTPLVIQKA